MSTTRSEILEVIYNFYPRGILPLERRHVDPGDPVYFDTEEYCRLFVAAARGRRSWPTWKAMIRRLAKKYVIQDESLFLLSGHIDPAYSGRTWVDVEEAFITFHVSLLGPYYGIRRSGVADDDPKAREIMSEIIREIETTYPGYRQIPPEIGNEALPDVCFNNSDFGKLTNYVLLFSDYWTQA